MMKSHCMTSLVAVLVLAASARPLEAQAEVEFAGRWESFPQSGVGPGRIVEFTDEGRVYLTTGSVVFGRYRAENDQLVQSATHPPETIIVRYRIQSDTMVQYSMQSSDSLRLVRRLTPMLSSGVVGSWAGRTESGEQYVLDYRPDNSFRLWIPSRTESATYRVSGDTIVVPAGKLRGRYTWSFSASELMLQPTTGSSGAVMVFVRGRE
jgi:hypothetical protein